MTLYSVRVWSRESGEVVVFGPYEDDGDDKRPMTAQSMVEDFNAMPEFEAKLVAGAA